MKVPSLKTIRKRIKAWNLPKIFLNKYVFTAFIFAVWMTFFDQNNLFTQIKRKTELSEARRKNNYYKEESAKLQKQITSLLSDKKALEKYAREKYYMKKPDEDVFVIRQEK